MREQKPFLARIENPIQLKSCLGNKSVNNGSHFVYFFGSRLSPWWSTSPLPRIKPEVQPTSREEIHIQVSPMFSKSCHRTLGIASI